MNDSALIVVAGLLAILPLLYIVGYGISLVRPAKRVQSICSFCSKSYRDVGPLVEGPGDVYICHPCCQLCEGIFQLEFERRKKDPSKAETSEVVESV